MKQTRITSILAVAIPLVVYIALQLKYGFYSGTNYDSYQYVYSLREGAGLERFDFAMTSRVYVHALYYFILRPIIMLGADAWTLFSSSNLGFSVASCWLVYYLATTIGANPWAALVGSSLWGLSGTGLYYANIPEVYPMWLTALLLTIMALWHKRPNLAVGAYVLSFVIYVQSILIVPMFLFLGVKRGLKLGTTAVLLGFVTLFLLLGTLNVPFLSNFLREGIYLDIASSDTHWFTTNVIALRQSGIIIPLILTIPLIVNYGDKATLFLALGIVPNLLFGLFWVKDQGAFLSPAAALSTVAFAYLSTKTKDYRPLLALALLFSIPLLTYAWKEAAYDRTLGKVQVEFCISASKEMTSNTEVISTALFPRWLYVFSMLSRDPSQVKYSPWAFVNSQTAAMHTARQTLFPLGVAVYADDSVHPDIVDGLERETILTHKGKLSNGYSAELRLYLYVRRRNN